MLRTTLAEEPVTLWPGRAVFWERAATLLIADAHLGKPAAFRSAGIPVPEAATAADLGRLDRLIEPTGARRLVVLGDLLHSRSGRAAETMEQVSAWRQRSGALELLLVRGNHDERAGDPPSDWRCRCATGPVFEPPFVFRHEPAPDRRGYVLAGHIHPAVVLRDSHGSSLRAPCFWFGAGGFKGNPCGVGVLPAFGSFTGARVVRPARGDRVFVIGDAEVAETGTPSAAPARGPA